MFIKKKGEYFYNGYGDMKKEGTMKKVLGV